MKGKTAVTSPSTRDTVAKFVVSLADNNNTPSAVKPYVVQIAPVVGTAVEFVEDLIPYINIAM